MNTLIASSRHCSVNSVTYCTHSLTFELTEGERVLTIVVEGIPARVVHSCVHAVAEGNQTAIGAAV